MGFWLVIPIFRRTVEARDTSDVAAEPAGPIVPRIAIVTGVDGSPK